MIKRCCVCRRWAADADDRAHRCPHEALDGSRSRRTCCQLAFDDGFDPPYVWFYMCHGVVHAGDYPHIAAAYELAGPTVLDVPDPG